MVGVTLHCPPPAHPPGSQAAASLEAPQSSMAPCSGAPPGSTQTLRAGRHDHVTIMGFHVIRSGCPHPWHSRRVQWPGGCTLLERGSGTAGEERGGMGGASTGRGGGPWGHPQGGEGAMGAATGRGGGHGGSHREGRRVEGTMGACTGRGGRPWGIHREGRRVEGDHEGMHREGRTAHSPPPSQWPRQRAPALCGTCPECSSASLSRAPPVSPGRGPSRLTSRAARTGRMSLGPSQTGKTQPPGEREPHFKHVLGGVAAGLTGRRSRIFGDATTRGFLKLRNIWWNRKKWL